MNTDENIQELIDLIAVTPNFPEKGIKFREISPLLAERMPETIDSFANLFKKYEIDGIDAFAGLEARGFIFASALAQYFGKNMVLIRKAGKLPPPTVLNDVKLEYGTAVFEMKPGKGRVILLDDVLATGGSFKSAADLCVKAGYEVKGFAALIDLAYLNNFEWNGLKAKSLIQFKD